MDKIEKIMKMYEYARTNGLCKNKKTFAELIGVRDTTLSRALAGGRDLTESFLLRANEALGNAFNPSWLLYDRGDMLMPAPQTTNVNVDMGDSIHHNSAPVIARGAQNVTVSTDDKDKIIAEQQAEIKALKEQVSDLTKSILNLTKQQLR